MKKQVIIIVSADEWDGIPRVRHQIANYFSQNHKVIFIENPRLTFLSLFRDIKRIKRIFSRNRIKQYGNIYIYSPQLSLPFWDKIALINEFNNFLLRQQIIPIIGISAHRLFIKIMRQVLIVYILLLKGDSFLPLALKSEF